MKLSEAMESIPCVYGRTPREQVDHLAGMTGMHEFAEFAAADVGTVDSGLNSIVLASNSEMVKWSPAQPLPPPHPPP